MGRAITDGGSISSPALGRTVTGGRTIPSAALGCPITGGRTISGGRTGGRTPNRASVAGPANISVAKTLGNAGIVVADALAMRRVMRPSAIVMADVVAVPIDTAAPISAATQGPAPERPRRAECETGPDDTKWGTASRPAP